MCYSLAECASLVAFLGYELPPALVCCQNRHPQSFPVQCCSRRHQTQWLCWQVVHFSRDRPCVKVSVTVSRQLSWCKRTMHLVALGVEKRGLPHPSLQSLLSEILALRALLSSVCLSPGFVGVVVRVELLGVN